MVLRVSGFRDLVTRYDIGWRRGDLYYVPTNRLRGWWTIHYGQKHCFYPMKHIAPREHLVGRVFLWSESGSADSVRYDVEWRMLSSAWWSPFTDRLRGYWHVVGLCRAGEL